MRRAWTFNELKQVTDKKLDECSYNVNASMLHRK